MRGKKPAPKNMANIMAGKTLRFLNRRGGRVPRSPCQNWIPMKTAIMAPKPTNSPMTRELLQG